MTRKLQFVALCVAALTSACSEASPTVTAPRLTPDAPSDQGQPQRQEKLVSIGTSISMGWSSNGVYAGSQQVSWPALIGFGLSHISLPLIQSPGCTSPIVAPLGGGVRLSGESITGSTVCAPNQAGVTLPTQNVALAAALAADAVLTTPEGTSNPWYGRVLPPGMTQLTAALSQHPTLVSVELGGNEVLNATSGLLLPGVTVVPLPFFISPYDALLDGIKSTGAKALLLGLPLDARHLPAMRRGDEIWADRAEFAALHVDVSSDCDGNQNYINVSVKSLNMVFTGAATSAHGLPNPVYSCADIPGTQDLVLTPSDMATVNGMLADMNTHIKDQATARGYAFATLGVLYDAPGLKPAHYSVIDQLTSAHPYGPLISLDGVHPTALGNFVIATAAAWAIETKYLNGAHPFPLAAKGRLSDQMDERMLPSVALAHAQRFAAEHQGDRVAACAATGGCELRGMRR